jgi:hypothetical protein
MIVRDRIEMSLEAPQHQYPGVEIRPVTCLLSVLRMRANH